MPACDPRRASPCHTGAEPASTYGDDSTAKTRDRRPGIAPRSTRILVSPCGPGGLALAKSQSKSHVREVLSRRGVPKSPFAEGPDRSATARPDAYRLPAPGAVEQ